MKLFAISDLHVGHRGTWAALEALAAHPGDWLIVAGDVAEQESDIIGTLALLSRRWAQVIWVPGNHELWSDSKSPQRGEAKYQQLISRCRELGVLTPEDPYPVWRGEGGPHLIAPLFLLYDYSFTDEGQSPAEAYAAAVAARTVCADEIFLDPSPFLSRQAWCDYRCEVTEARLAAAVAEHPFPLVLVNHFPLKQAHAVLPLIPRFQIWCGTRRTEDWPARFRASVVVSGHLHIRTTRVEQGCRYEEVSLGYPGRQWQVARGIEPYLRQLLPEAASPESRRR